MAPVLREHDRCLVCVFQGGIEAVILVEAKLFIF
jgi:hypothetical protein